MSKKIFILLAVLIVLGAAIKLQSQKSEAYCQNCNVVLIGIDALRADHLGVYGYDRKTSPNIDLLAKNGVIFKNNYSQSITTTPSFMALFTSLYPTDTGVLFTNPASYGYPEVQINKDIETLPQIMKANGYETKALVSSSALPSNVGFGRGFDSFSLDSVATQRKELLSFIKSNKNKKFFVFFHDLTTHAPYLPSQRSLDLFENTKDFPTTQQNPQKIYSVKDFFSQFDRNNPSSLQHLTNLYDASIKDVDDFVGELTTEIKKENLENKTVIVFMSDHGDELSDHGIFDHQEFYNEISHVPLIITIPGTKHEDINQTTRTIDIMPTIFDLVGIKNNTKIRGISLLSMIKNPNINLHLAAITIMGAGKSVALDGYKFIDQLSFQPHLNKPLTLELYDLSTDPKEKNNLVSKNLPIKKKLEDLYLSTVNDNIFSKEPTILNTDPNDKAINELRRLGY